MEWSNVTILVSVITAISGIMLGWLGRNRTLRRDIQKEAIEKAIQQTDVEYIKRGIDDIRYDVRSQGKEVVELTERVARNEESIKEAHNRLDRMGAE